MKLKRHPDPVTDVLFETVWRLGDLVDQAEEDSEAVHRLAAARWEGAMAALASALLEQGRIDAHASGPLGSDFGQGDVQQADVLMWAWAVRTGRVTQEKFDAEMKGHWPLAEALAALEARA